VGDREYIVDIESDHILVDGEVVDVDLEQAGVDELYSVLFGGRSYELLIEPRRYTYDITLKGEFYSVQVEDERARRMNASRKMALPEGELAIIAPIPGLVVKVLVVEGEAIEEGQPLVLLEAMKMENELRAARPGTVKQVKVAAGQRVEQHAVLIVLE
jgi:biotin carboxyl carrier protein